MSAVQEPGYLDKIYLDSIHLDFIYLDNIHLEFIFIGLNMNSVTHTLVPMQAYSSSIDYQHFAALEKNCLTSTQ